MKKNRLFTFMNVLIIIIIICTGCKLDKNSHENSTTYGIGIVLEGIDVPDTVLDAAKAKVQESFEIVSEEFPDYGYMDWRIENLDYIYTYDDLDGMELVIYQMNYEFLSESPENIVMAGGMYITEDNWVMPSYPNNIYLIFQQEDNTLSFMGSIMINDSVPGDETFTNDILRLLTD